MFISNDGTHVQCIGQTHSHFLASVIPQSDRDAINKIYITVMLFVFRDAVAPLTTGVINDIDHEEDTGIRQQGPLVNGNQPPGI